MKRTTPYRLTIRRHHEKAMMKTLAGMLLGAMLAIYIEENT